jgi:hypothetical protein
LRLGQNGTASGASEAVALYDSLVARVSNIADEEGRGEILKWIGRADVPGAPAERYQVVRNGVASGEAPDGLFMDRVKQLKEINAELSAKVINAEKAYGVLSAPEGAGSRPEAGMGGLCLAGGVALLGLVVLPLVLD